MSLRLIELLFPPVYFARRRRWAGCILAVVFLLLATGLAWRGFLRWAEAPRSFWVTGPNEFVFAAPFWAMPVGWVLAEGRPRARAVLTVLAVLFLLAATAVHLSRGVNLQTRLASDQGTLAALRSAISIYYGLNDGTFPTHPENYVGSFSMHCPRFAYAYDRTTGKVKVTSTNTIDDCL